MSFILMSPTEKSAIRMDIDKWDYNKYYPNGFECATTQHNTGSEDYYCCFFDAEEGGKYNQNALWIARTISREGGGIRPTGNFCILHKVWKGEGDDWSEHNESVDLTLKELKELFY